GAGTARASRDRGARLRRHARTAPVAAARPRSDRGALDGAHRRHLSAGAGGQGTRTRREGTAARARRAANPARATLNAMKTRLFGSTGIAVPVIANAAGGELRLSAEEVVRIDDAFPPGP